MVILLLLILSDGDDPMLAQCCTSVVDSPSIEPALRHCLVVAVWCIHIEGFKADLRPVIWIQGR